MGFEIDLLGLAARKGQDYHPSTPRWYGGVRGRHGMAGGLRAPRMDNIPLILISLFAIVAVTVAHTALHTSHVRVGARRQSIASFTESQCSCPPFLFPHSLPLLRVVVVGQASRRGSLI